MTDAVKTKETEEDLAERALRATIDEVNTFNSVVNDHKLTIEKLGVETLTDEDKVDGIVRQFDVKLLFADGEVLQLPLFGVVMEAGGRGIGLAHVHLRPDDMSALDHVKGQHIAERIVHNALVFLGEIKKAEGT